MIPGTYQRESTAQHGTAPHSTSPNGSARRCWAGLSWAELSWELSWVWIASWCRVLVHRSVVIHSRKVVIEWCYLVGFLQENVEKRYHVLGTNESLLEHMIYKYPAAVVCYKWTRGKEKSNVIHHTLCMWKRICSSGHHIKRNNQRHQ